MKKKILVGKTLTMFSSSKVNDIVYVRTLEDNILFGLEDEQWV